MSKANVNDTIVSILESKGWHPSVGKAFCMGLESSGRFNEIRDIVCAVYKKKVFTARDQSDLDNPEKLFINARHVISRSGKFKFYPPFIMDKQEILLFMARFPEVEVIYHAAKSENPHAFHANCRHVSTEILIGYIYRHAQLFGGDPTSIIDVGGNEAYHQMRKRTVHCDTPVLSARDKARYLLRDVYSGSSPDKRCSFTFQNCHHSASFGMSVHSTYDMSPLEIARAMHKKRVTAFFGVIVIPCDLEHLSDGDHDCDGTHITLSGDSMTFTFPSDSSVAYTHSKSVMLQYLKTRQMLSVNTETNYAYRIVSIRGDTLFFSIIPMANDERVWGPPTSVVPCMDKYFVSVHGLTTKPLVFDAQPFDRAVLNAAGQKNFKDYDITALFRYVKSLRAGLSINGIPISRGYAYKPEDVVIMTVAAYCCAASFRIEVAEFFKDVTAKINSKRDFGIFRNVCSVASSSFLMLLGALVKGSGLSTLYGMTSSALDEMLRNVPGVTVSVSNAPPPQIAAIEHVSDTVMASVSHDHMSMPVPQIAPAQLAGPSTAIRFSRHSTMSVPVKKAGSIVLCTTLLVPPDKSASVAPTELSDFLLSTRELNVTPWMDHSGSEASYNDLCNQAFVEMVRAANRSVNLLIEPAVMTSEGDWSINVPSKRKRYVVRGAGRYCSNVAGFGKMMASRHTTCIVRYDHDLTQSLPLKVADHSYTTGNPSLDFVLNSLVSRVQSSASSSSIDSISDAITRDMSSTAFGSAVVDSDRVSIRTLSSSVLSESIAVESDVPVSLAVPDPSDHAQIIPEFSLQSTSSAASDEGTVSLDNRIQSLAGMQPGQNSVNELGYLCDVTRDAAESLCKMYISMAEVVENQSFPQTTWTSIAAATADDPVLLSVQDGKLYDILTGEKVDYMAVYFGDTVLTRSQYEKLPFGTHVISCNPMKIWVEDGIRSAVNKYSAVDYECDVTLLDAPAANGKTYAITNAATIRDFVVCETSSALEELKRGLVERDAAFEGRCFTVDSVLVNDRVVDSVDVLYIDEALRLHAGKIWLLIRMLKPSSVLAYGDQHQIRTICFQKSYSFYYHVFPWSRVDVSDVSRVMLPEVACALSQPGYYDRHIMTHNSSVGGILETKMYTSQVIADEAATTDTVVLTYTQNAKKDLRRAGISNCFTIGEVQGNRWDKVVLFRDSSLKKVLYYNSAQTLVALTRARKQFRYVTVVAIDDSLAAKCVAFASAHAADVPSHIVRPDVGPSWADDFDF